MKRCNRILSVLIVISLFLPLLAVYPIHASAQADNAEARYTQKIVSVVYDNSGSMLYDPIREPAARYSLEMLMSLLDERDQMSITPMNDGTTGLSINDPSLCIDVDLSAADRNAELDRILALPQLASTISAGTPADSIGIAVDELAALGLKDSAHLIDSDPDKEYWLVILTDGDFDAVTANPNYFSQAQKIEHFIKDYPTLHTVYVGLGKDAEDLSNDSSMDSYLFTPYKSTEAELASVIQQISNQMAGRYPLDPTVYTVNGNTVTVNLEMLPFSLASLSLIAQNCGATVNSAAYSGSRLTVEKPCVIEPDSQLGMKSGFSCRVSGEPYFMGGSVTFEFSGPVDADRLSIFAEPALSISYYLECMINSSWERVDLKYINSNLKKGDKIRVGYEVYEQVNKTAVDLEKVFGKVESKVLYDQTTYEIGSEIPLITGSNPLDIEVSVMDGDYTLRDSETITIEEDPTAFRIEVSGDTEIPVGSDKATAVFTVYIDGKPASADQLKDYTYDVTAASSGSYTCDVNATMASDGKIRAELTVEDGKFDVYTVGLTVESPLQLSRSASHDITYFPDSLALEVSGADHLSVTQYELEDNQNGFTFTLSTNGQPFPIHNGLTEFKLLADGVDVSEFASVSGNTLTFIPTAENLGAVAEKPGEKEIVLILESASHPSLNTQASARLTVDETLYTVVCLDDSKRSVDRFDLANTDAALYFEVLRDGNPISAEELKAAYESGELKFTYGGLFGAMFWLPCGIESALETVDGVPVLAVHAVKDMPRYFEWHYSAFITDGDKPITVTYKTAEAIDHFTFESSSVFEHILRIFLLVLAHALLIYVIIYLIGFWIAKPLPTGVFVVINSMGSISITPVNDTIWKRYGWHLLRFVLPWKVLTSQSVERQAPYCSDITFGFDAKADLHFSTYSSNVYSVYYNSPAAEDAINDLHTRISNGTYPNTLNQITNISAKRLFARNEPILQDARITMGSKMYVARYTGSNNHNMTFSYAVCFYNLYQ